MVTGTPTKIKSSKLTDEEKANLRSALMLKNELPLVLVFGGSQGARSINNAIIGIIENKLNKNYQIIWAAGKGNFENIKQQLAEKNMDIDNIENAKIMPYIYNMQEVMETSDLVVSRSGAMTITEISNLAKPAIFIPFPFATENHQEYNARVLEKVGAAKIILDKNLNYKNLNDTIELMVENKEQLKEMGKKAGKIANTNVEENIYNEIRNILSKN